MMVLILKVSGSYQKQLAVSDWRYIANKILTAF